MTKEKISELKDEYEEITNNAVYRDRTGKYERITFICVS